MTTSCPGRSVTHHLWHTCGTDCISISAPLAEKLSGNTLLCVEATSPSSTNLSKADNSPSSRPLTYLPTRSLSRVPTQIKVEGRDYGDQSQGHGTPIEDFNLINVNNPTFHYPGTEVLA